MNSLKFGRIRYVGAIIGIMTALLIFLPVLSGGADQSYTGIQIVFGYDLIDFGDLISAEITFSVFNLFAFLLPLIGALSLIFIKESQLLASFIFILSAVIFFFVPNFTTVTQTLMGVTSNVTIDWSFEIGLVIAIILSLIAAMISILGMITERDSN